VVVGSAPGRHGGQLVAHLGAAAAAVAQRISSLGGNADGGGGMFDHPAGGQVAQEFAHFLGREAIVPRLAAAGREAFFDRIVDAFGEHVVEQVGMEGRGLRAWLARRDGVRVGRVGCGVRLGGAGGGGILHADAHPGPVGALLGVGGEAAVGGAARGRAGA